MGRNEFYNYTPYGNRSMRSIIAGSPPVSEQYQYYPNSDLLQYDGTYYYAYDENGNLTERGDSATITDSEITINRTGTYRHYSWDLLNRLETVEELDEEGNLEVIKEYGYDVNNLRIWEKNRHGQITHYVYNQKGNRIERHTDEQSEYYIFRNLRHIAKRVVDHSTNTEKTYFYGTDHLGSTVLMTDEDGNEVFSAETTPFGDSVSELGPMADTENLMYTGKDLDEDTGLYYFNARWYDPTVGRFISEDPARDGRAWYVYVANNPLRYVDPSGLISQEHETELENLRDLGMPESVLSNIRYTMIEEEKTGISELYAERDQIQSITNDEEWIQEIDSQIQSAEDDLIRNILVEDYNQSEPLVNLILNDRLADEAEKYVGTPYIWGGKPDNDKGGLDCSGTAEAVIEQASGILLRTRNANGQATDPNLTVAGDGSRGTLNYYDWGNLSDPDGVYDHVTIKLGNGLMVHPQGGRTNDTPSNAGTIIIRGSFRPVHNVQNRQVNWRYILFE